MTEGFGTEPQGTELQFDKVELASPEASRTCPFCQALVGGEYYEVSGNVICAACAKQLAGKQGWGMFLRALAFGAGAAVVSTIAWFLIIKATDGEWGIVAIAVGFFIGFAVRRGSRGLGGARYQALAMGLTYLSVTMSHVPLVVEGLRQAGAERETKDQPTLTAAKSHSTPPASEPTAVEPRPTLGTFALAWLFVFGIAFASPFLAGMSGIMGLIIIGIALYEAWKLNRRVPVTGPFRFGSASATP